jgi:ELWxxDGT repeat protein
MLFRAVRCLRFPLTLLILLTAAGLAQAQPLAHLVRDLNTSDAHSLGQNYQPTPATIGTTLFFTADDGGSGDELWKLDTLTGATALVKDICPGPCSSSPLWLTVLGNLVIFRATDGPHGVELWRSDGTADGTFLLKDVNPGGDGGYAGPWIDAVGGKVLFSGPDPILGAGLWSTDGTREGTQLVARVGPTSTEIDPLAVAGGRLLFAADDGVHGQEPWISDGTAAGTHLIRDLDPGSGSAFSFPRARKFAAGLPDGSFVFAASDGTLGAELWRTDGTEAGTVLVKDLNPGAADSSPEGFVLLGGKVYFIAGSALWATDGTPAGTLYISATDGPSYSPPEFMTRVGSRIYFTSGDNTLWTSDGTAGGTLSLNVGGVLAIGSLGSSAMVLTARRPFDPFLLLWKTDGTQAGTVQVKNLGQAPCSYYSFPPAEAGGELYFYTCLSGGGDFFWKSDGTQAGTTQVQAPVRTSSFRFFYSGSTEDFLTPLGGGLYFSANDGVSGLRAWHTDGSVAGTQAVTSSAYGLFPPISLGSSLIYVTGGVWRMDADGSVEELVSQAADYPVRRAGNQVFFPVYTPGGSFGGSYDTWKTDGTAAGTAVIPGTNHPFAPDFLGAAGSVLLYEKNTSELWRTDGTGAGTFLLQSNRPAFDSATVGNDVYFSSWDADGYWMLWKTDGTGAGTVAVRTFPEVLPYQNGSGFDFLTPAGNRLFFTFTDPTYGQELWVSDGSEAGTYRVKDILPGAGSSGIRALFPLGSRVFFAANDGVHGIELWVSDGTDAGTHIVKDILPGSPSSGVSPGVIVGSRLFFTADDGTHGIEPWTSDGTDAGTHMVKDILPGADSSLPMALAPVGNHVVLTASDGIHGAETWVSDGTDAGTFMLQDIAPGVASAGPASYTIGSSSVYFVADDGTTGAELWTAPRAALEPTFTDVHSTYWAWRSVEAVATAGITLGCGQGLFCPERTLTRAEMGVFLGRGLHGAAFVPPPATGTRFTDVPASYWAANWIEQIATDGITQGCAASPARFCPAAQVARAEMAIFLLRARHGAAYTPPPATGTRFTDVPANFWAAAWIEQLAAEGITNGCDTNLYCPNKTVGRAEMAVFLTRAFNLPLP